MAPEADRVVIFHSATTLHKVAPTFSKRVAMTCWWFDEGIGETRRPVGNLSSRVVLLPPPGPECGAGSTVGSTERCRVVNDSMQLAKAALGEIQCRD